MIHVGDITKLSGHTLPPVDVITGGSPCQDLSIAGVRKGLDGERSGLFLEQIRIVRELREADRKRGRTNQLVRPRFMVWENVCGAFSSNKGRDFQRVLTECVRIAEPSAPDVPYPDNGKWTKSGVLMGDGWSVAWRVLDAQYWGVPQRRRRIALVCDFGGQSAGGEILFVREGLSGHFETGGAERQGITGAVETCAYPPIARTLTARMDGSPCIDRGPEIIVQNGVKCLNPWDSQSGRVYDADGVFHSLTSCENAGMQRDAVLTYDARGNGDGQTVCTLTGDHANRVTDYTPIVARCLTANCYKQKGREDAETYLSTGGIVRRLTPLECERLQGFPDNYTNIGEWTDDNGKTHKTSDSARYRALGNSIALPPWKWVLKRIAAQYERDATLGSLFDGIGGFPLLWEQFNGKGSALFASEIEPFCIAITKRRLG